MSFVKTAADHAYPAHDQADAYAGKKNQVEHGRVVSAIQRLSDIGSDGQGFEIGIGIEIGCSTATIDSDSDFDNKDIRDTERSSGNRYRGSNRMFTIRA